MTPHLTVHLVAEQDGVPAHLELQVVGGPVLSLSADDALFVSRVLFKAAHLLGGEAVELRAIQQAFGGDAAHAARILRDLKFVVMKPHGTPT